MSYAIKHGYTSQTLMAHDIAKVMIAAGYTLVSQDGTAKDTLAAPSEGANSISLVLDSSAAVDPCFADGQVYRALIEVKSGSLDICFATPTQISEAGTVAAFPIANGGKMGRLTKDGKTSNTTPNNSWFEAALATGSVSAGAVDLRAAPQSMMVVASKHGLAVMRWTEGYDDSGKAFSWFCVQRGVDSSGTPHTTKKAPLWCVYSIGGTDIFQFVVRESDVNAPTPPTTATDDGDDSNRLFNCKQQVSITESEKFNLAIPRDITTQRYFYPLELDMIGYSSADVISQYSEAPVRMYGEAADRVYKAMNANGAKNTNMRILFLAKQDDKLIDVSGALNA